jgi:glycosyltransferase involved in cell wall biosynthesis
MRIAIVAEVFLPKIDGVVNRTLHLIRELTRCGDEVLVVCPHADGSKASGARVVEARSFPFPLYPEYRIGLPDPRLAKEVEQFTPDVLHYVNPFAFGFRCYEVFRRAGLRVPSVFSFHTLYGEFVKQYKALKPLSRVLWWMMREYHNRADVNITVSGIMQEELTVRGFQRVRCWPPAVDGRMFHPDRKSREMRFRLTNGRPERSLLLTVSRLAPEKNVGALAEVLDQLPGTSLAVVGDGPGRADLERRFAGRDAHFVGYLKGDDLAAAYASADAFVYASETETMGNVVLEAMACGCAVVAPRAGGIPDLVTHDDTGLLYRPGDVADAAVQTRSVLGDIDLRTRLGRNARGTVMSWDWEHSVDRVRQFYLEAILLRHPEPARVTWGQRSAWAVTTALVAVFRARAAVGRQRRRSLVA